MDKFWWIWFIVYLQIIGIFSKPRSRPKRFTEFSIQCREYNDFTWECLCPRRNVIMTLKNSDDAFLVCGIDFKLSLLSKTPHYPANQQELASDYDKMVQHERPNKNIWGDHEYHRTSSFDRDEYDPHKDPKGYQTGSDWNEAEPNTHLKHNNPGNKEEYDRSRPGYNNMEHHSRQSQRYPDVNDRYVNTEDEQFESNDEEKRYNQKHNKKFGNDGRFQNENNIKTNKNPHSTTTDLFQRNPSATIATTDGMISQEKLDENLHEVLSGYPTDSSEMNDTNNNNDEQDIPVGADSEKEDTSLEKEENIDQEVPEPNSQNNDNGERSSYELTHETSTSLIAQKEIPVIPIYTTVQMKSTLLQSSKTFKEQTVSEQNIKRKTTVHKNDKTATVKPTIYKNARLMTVKPVIQQKTQELTKLHDTKHTHKTEVNQDTNRPEITNHNNNNGRSMPGIDTRYKTDKTVVTQQRMNVNSGPIDKGDFREDPKTVKKTNNSTNDKTIHDSRYAGDTTGISTGENKNETSGGCYFFGKMFSIGQFLKISSGCIMMCVKQNMMKRDCTRTHTLQNKPDPNNAIANWHP